MNLHILNQSPNKSSAMQDMLSTVTEGDAVILIEDGVIALNTPEIDAKALNTAIYVLEADLLARGLTERIKDTFTVVNDDEFVKLCCEYSKTISWF